MRHVRWIFNFYKNTLNFPRQTASKFFEKPNHAASSFVSVKKPNFTKISHCSCSSLPPSIFIIICPRFGTGTDLIRKVGNCLIVPTQDETNSTMINGLLCVRLLFPFIKFLGSCRALKLKRYFVVHKMDMDMNMKAQFQNLLEE